MQPFFWILFFLAVAMTLLWRVRYECKKRSSLRPGVIRIWIIVQNQEPWIEGFIRKLFRIIRGSPFLEVYIIDDCSSDCTAEVLHQMGRIYPFKVLSIGDRPLENGFPDAGLQAACSLWFDVRGLRGKGLLNATLLGHLSRLNEGNLQILSN